MVMQSVDYVVMQSGATGNARFIIDGGFDSDTGTGEFRVSSLMKEALPVKDFHVIPGYHASGAVNEVMDCIIYWMEVEEDRFPLNLEKCLGHGVSDYAFRKSKEYLNVIYGYRFKNGEYGLELI